MWMLLALALASGKLLCVIEVSRHGARTPIDQFAWDTGSWPEGPGELTASGMRQHYLIGRELKYRYIEQTQLLTPAYLQEEVYVRSTDTNRTYMSAEAQLMGLYPTGQMLNNTSLAQRAVPPLKGLNTTEIEELGLKAIVNQFQPVPIHSVQAAQDFLLRSYSAKVCPKMAVYMKELQKESEYQKRLAGYEAPGGLKERVEAVLGEGRSISYIECGFIGDDLRILKWFGYSLPKGLTESLYEEILDVLVYQISYYFKGQGGNLAASEYFSAVLKYFTGALEKTSPKKFIFYSAHDITLNAFTTALGIYRGAPPFASTLILELYDDSTVKIKYNDQDEPLPNCSEHPCPFSEFKALLEAKIVENVPAACNDVTEEEYQATRRLRDNEQYSRL